MWRNLSYNILILLELSKDDIAALKTRSYTCLDETELVGGCFLLSDCPRAGGGVKGKEGMSIWKIDRCGIMGERD